MSFFEPDPPQPSFTPQPIVYPNGFSMAFTILTEPNAGRAGSGTRMLMSGSGGLGGPHGFPRVGVRFSDGRTAGDRTRLFGGMDVPKDDEGIPTQPIISGAGGGGGQYGFQLSFWVFPLPPAGPLEIFTAVRSPDPGERDETKMTLDGTAIRAAAEHAQVIWT